MRGTQHRQDLSGYRDEVTELIEAGEPFDIVESAIDEAADLTRDQKAGLWLFAFSLLDRDQQQRDARAHLAFLQ